MSEVFLSTINKEKELISFSDLEKTEQDSLLYGSKKLIHFNFTFNNSEYSFKDKFPGLVSFIKTQVTKRVILQSFQKTCSVCHRSRLSTESIEYEVNGKNIFDLSSMETNELLHWFQKIKTLKKKKNNCNSITKRNYFKTQFS